MSYMTRQRGRCYAWIYHHSHTEKPAHNLMSHKQRNNHGWINMDCKVDDLLSYCLCVYCVRVVWAHMEMELIQWECAWVERTKSPCWEHTSNKTPTEKMLSLVLNRHAHTHTYTLKLLWRTGLCAGICMYARACIQAKTKKIYREKGLAEMIRGEGVWEPDASFIY